MQSQFSDNCGMVQIVNMVKIYQWLSGIKSHGDCREKVHYDMSTDASQRPATPSVMLSISFYRDQGEGDWGRKGREVGEGEWKYSYITCECIRLKNGSHSKHAILKMNLVITNVSNLLLLLDVPHVEVKKREYESWEDTTKRCVQSLLLKHHYSRHLSQVRCM